VEGNRISKHQVELVARQNDMQIIDGISPGTRIVARDVTLLADGQVVHAE
jgi:hypothetical protein